MPVRLISYSQPSDEFKKEWSGNPDIQDLIVYCARVSNPSNQTNQDTANKLLNYLAKHAHWSPFELVSVCLEIETTRDIARQILRHRSFSFQEFCVSGDTEIHFAVPAKLKKGSYAPTRKMKISELYDKWANGSAPSGANKTRMPMKHRISEMKIKVYNEETNKLETSFIKEVFKTGKKDIYQIALSDGKKIKTTKEHKFLTKDGFLDLETAVGLVRNNNTALMTKNPLIAVNGELEYRNREWLLSAKKESLFLGGGIQYIVQKYGYNYNTIRKWLKIHNIGYTKKENAITFNVWNKNKRGYSLPKKSLETKKKHQLSAKKGKDSNLWRGGNSSKRQGVDPIEAYEFRKTKNFTCERCGTYGNTDIHHKVPVSVDPSLEHDQHNWELLCRSCHIKHHKKEDYSGWQAMGATARKQSAYVPKWVTVEKIEFLGQEETYDIEVEHASHNYIANGIIVHNSQRYADPTKDLDFVVREARLQDTKNRQNSIEVDDPELKEFWEEKQKEVIRKSKEVYDWAISNGIAKEQARAVLPEGLMSSRMYMNGTIRSWLHFIQLRSGNGTQKEHAEIARACAEAIAKIFPLSEEYISK